MESENNALMISGLNHFAFCKRSWALIHIEQQWAENLHTTEGELFHHRAHDEMQTEVRGDTIIMRGLRVQSKRLDITGACDVVEFHRAPEGITLSGRDGLYTVHPIEYKKGAPPIADGVDAHQLQLCAQAICLEEMLLCHISEGSLFYGQTRRRVHVPLTQALRGEVEEMLREMHQYWVRGYTPKVKPHKGCRGCSMSEICLPALKKTPEVSAYLRSHVVEEER